MQKNKEVVTLSTDEISVILNNLKNNCVLHHEDTTTSALDEDLKHIFLSREVALLVKSNISLEENTFLLVKFPYTDKVLDISIGYIKMDKNETPKLTYGVIHR